MLSGLKAASEGGKRWKICFKSFRQKYLGTLLLFRNSVIYMLYLEATKRHGEHFSYVGVFYMFALSDKLVTFGNLTITLWEELGHL